MESNSTHWRNINRIAEMGPVASRDLPDPRRHEGWVKSDGIGKVFLRFLNTNLDGGFKYFFNVHPYLGKWSNLTNIF